MSGIEAVLIALFIWAAPAYVGADMNMSAFQCGPKMIRLGASKLEVQVACGIPDMKDIVAARVRSRRYRGRTSAIVTSHEQWMFNCGVGRFFKILTFENGRLIVIENGPSHTRGTGPVRCS